ncbi:hypothetical protein MCUN1_003057 [Malassezia cuniculi]|uniref:Uncharacterized protein n=1 Tax=Malassezia cuniculi TaxID=948313 RepID=A0AAF0J7K1_9BASI|nr:hypothetical protein MCUN1_003057 [Malassezia cuniculi]
MPESDAAYQTLRRLLLSPASSTQHIALLESNAFFGSIGHYLAALSLPNVTDLTHLVVSSAALWTAPTPEKASAPTYPLVTRTVFVAQAAAFAVSERVPLIAKHAPRTAKRELRQWLRAIIAGAGIGSADAAPRTLLPQLALLTGLLQGLDAVRSTRERVSIGFGRHAYALQQHWANVFSRLLDSWSVARGTDAQWRRSAWALGSDGSRDDTPCTAVLSLAVLVAGAIADDLLHASNNETLVRMAGPVLFGIYGNVEGMFDDLQSADVVSVSATSRCSVWVNDVQTHPLYPKLGPLSRLVGGALRRCTETLSPEALDELCFGHAGPLAALQATALHLDNSWSKSALAGRSEDQIEMSSRRTTTLIWQTFKTLLFSVTMVYDALVEGIVDQLPSPTVTYAARGTEPSTSNIPLTYLTALRSVLETFMHLYFVTSSFGLDGFEAYRKVFFACLDVLGRDGRASIGTLEDLVAQRGGTRPVPAAEASFSERMRTTYYLLVAEQLVADVPDQIIEHQVLPVCVPYLEDPRYQDTFESAHTVVLALFAARKACSYELAPFYVDLLLSSYPERLSESQLETALTTVVSSLSETSDAAAWWVIEQLHDTLDDLRITPPPPGKHTSIDLVIGRCMAALLAHVNLVLFRSLLTRVHALIVTHAPGSRERTILVEKTFEALGELNAATREEGMRWWLKHCKDFTGHDAVDEKAVSTTTQVQ